VILNGHLLKVIALGVVVCSGYANSDTPVLIGPYAVSGSGEFLFCGVKRGSDDRRYVIVPLRDSRRGPQVLTFAGTDRCLGAAWRPGTHPEELLFVTGGESQAIKRFRMSSAGVQEISSHRVDPNLLVTLPPDCWNPKGTVFALRVEQFGKGASPHGLLGFTKDNGKTIRLSAIRIPTHMVWVDDSTLYMIDVVDADETTEYKLEVDGLVMPMYEVYIKTISKAQVNVDSLTVTTHQILQDKNITLASGNLHGSFLYSKGGELFRDGKTFVVLPEKIDHARADGDYIVAVSADKRSLFTIDAGGKVVSRQKTREDSNGIGVSAETQSAYLTSSSREDRVRICAYDFLGKSVETVFEAGSLWGTDKEGDSGVRQ
jgi:hypothetical protein